MLAKYAQLAIMVAVLLFAAGIYSGQLQGSGMVPAMAQSLAAGIPGFLSPLMPVILGVLSMPLSLVLPADAFYYSVLPVFAEAGKLVGIDPAIMARAALMGHTTLGAPISPLNAATFVLNTRLGLNLADHQRLAFNGFYSSLSS